MQDRPKKEKEKGQATGNLDGIQDWFQKFSRPSYTQDLPKISCFVRIHSIHLIKYLFKVLLKKRFFF